MGDRAAINRGERPEIGRILDITYPMEGEPYAALDMGGNLTVLINLRKLELVPPPNEVAS